MTDLSALDYLRDAAGHLPVMLREVIRYANPSDRDVCVDGTFGAGGYSCALLDQAGCSLWGIDRDPDAAPRAKSRMAPYGNRFQFVAGAFGDMEALLKARGVEAVDAIVLDIGVSSFQLDESARGFSFQSDGPLDMRMAQTGESAADVVNSYDAERLADIFYTYGEERASRKIAAAIVHDRSTQPFSSTRQLASLIERLLGRPRPKSGKSIHPATRVFQALRIHVNDELGELRRALQASERLLRPGGRLVVVSFHSLEDRIVKEFLATRSGAQPMGSRHRPDAGARVKPSFTLFTRGAITPQQDECAINPRARSARLRGGVRTDAPVLVGEER